MRGQRDRPQVCRPIRHQGFRQQRHHRPIPFLRNLAFSKNGIEEGGERGQGHFILYHLLQHFIGNLIRTNGLGVFTCQNGILPPAPRRGLTLRPSVQPCVLPGLHRPPPGHPQQRHPGNDHGCSGSGRHCQRC